MFRVWIVLVWLAQAPTGVPLEERLARHRNLGKAFYENPTTQNESVIEFRRALELAPQSTREKLNLGLALLRAANNVEGLKWLEEVQRTDPKLPHTWFNLGIHWKKQGEADKAVAQFRELVKLAPQEPKAHYNLAASLRLGGNNAEAL
ncbi:MAG: tetratricopeptide repeat protein, partial [Bryobacteraceae bacterium]|nr:tetratricopeptide repeat protein [Bryobacteraceae bacterium]